MVNVTVSENEWMFREIAMDSLRQGVLCFRMFPIWLKGGIGGENKGVFFYSVWGCTKLDGRVVCAKLAEGVVWR